MQHIWFQLLSLLYNHTNLSSSQLEQKLQVHKRTLLQAVEELNQRFNGVAYIAIKDKHYRLIIKDFNEYKNIIHSRLLDRIDFNEPQKRISYILMRLLNSDQHIQIESLSEEMNVSRGTVNNDLKKIKQILSGYDVVFYGQSGKGLLVSGKEYDKRILLLKYVYDYFPDSFELISNIREAIDLISKHFKLNVVHSGLLLKNTAISVKRMCLGHDVEAVPYYINYEQSSETLSNLFRLVEETYSIQLSELEKDFLSYPVNIRTTSYVNPNTLIPHEPMARLLFDKIIHEIRQRIYVDLDEKDLFDSMKYHMMLLINRIVFHTENVDSFWEELINGYPLSVQLSKIAVEVLEKELNRTISDIEISYLAVYFELSLKAKNEKDPKKIAIVCSTGRGTTQLIRKRIAELFGDGLNITEYSEYDYHHQDFSKFHIVFSSIPIEATPGVPVIRMSNLFAGDFSLDQVHSAKTLGQLHLNAVIKTVIPLSKKISYTNALTKIVQELQKKGFVDNKFLNRILERENKASTVFNQGVAIPHALLDTHVPIIAVGIYESPVHYKSQVVQLVFLLGIPKEVTATSEQTLIAIYDMIFRIAQSTEITRPILDMTNTEELVRYIYEEGLY